MDSFEFLLILRIALVVILYLAILQIVVVARRELRQAPAFVAGGTRPQSVVGHLLVLDKGSATNIRIGQRLDIEPITTIGRAPTNTIVLDSKYVSVVHVRIIYRDRTLWVEDAGATNKAKLEGQDVVQPIPVRPDNILQVGDVRLRFTL